MSAADSYLRVNHVAKRFGGVLAVRDATFEVPASTITGLIGPNGAGKSTALGIIAGQIRPDAGSVWYGEEEVTGVSPHRLAVHGVVRTFQRSSEFGRLTLFENLLVGAQNQTGEKFWSSVLRKRRWKSEEARIHMRAEGLLERFGLTSLRNEPAENLSGGQKRLLEIMRALMAEPRLLLLDEPLAGVSPVAVPEILRHLAELRADGLTMLLIEHDLAAIEQLCNSVVIMAEGAVLASGDMMTLRSLDEVKSAYLVG